MAPVVMGFATAVFIFIQFDGVHLVPILKVLRGIMNITRLVIQNRAAFRPAGPSGKKAQKKDEILAVRLVSDSLTEKLQHLLYQSPETAETDRCHSKATAAA